MTITLDRPIVKVTRFTAFDAEGSVYRWAFWYDSGYRAWFLRDYEGYERRLAENWTDSVPRIHGILANHGMRSELS